MTSPTRCAPCSSVAPPSDSTLAALILGWKWGGQAGTAASVSLSFPSSDSVWSTDPLFGYGPNSDTTREPWNPHYSGLDATEKTGVRAALSAWDAEANAGIAEIAETSSSVGDIRVAFTAGAKMDKNTFAYTWVGTAPPSSREAAFGDIWLNAFQPVDPGYDFSLGACGYSTVLHELGHAIGLAHPFESGAFPAQYDCFKYTVMSYSDAPGHYDQGDCSIYPTTPMLLDILAIQYLYGANTSHHAADDTYAFQEGQKYYQTLWDGGGNDTIVYSSASGGLIDLREGFFSQLGRPVALGNGTLQADTVAIAYGTVIENAFGGSGDDILYGNDAGNDLRGYAGNDHLRGGPGNDALDGGTGLDVALYARAHDIFSVSLSASGATVADNGGAEGADSLSSIERLDFSDGTLALDIGKWQTSGEAYRLYQAAFARPPDTAGLKYWIVEMDGGQTHEQVAHNFMVSQEFQAKYGTGLTHEQYVAELYRNALHRTPDADGYNYWVGLLDDGKITPEQTLINFSESDENVTFVGVAIQDGIWLG